MQLTINLKSQLVRRNRRSLNCNLVSSFRKLMALPNSLVGFTLKLMKIGSTQSGQVPVGSLKLSRVLNMNTKGQLLYLRMRISRRRSTRDLLHSSKKMKIQKKRTNNNIQGQPCFSRIQRVFWRRKSTDPLGSFWKMNYFKQNSKKAKLKHQMEPIFTLKISLTSVLLKSATTMKNWTKYAAGINIQINNITEDVFSK